MAISLCRFLLIHTDNHAGRLEQGTGLAAYLQAEPGSAVMGNHGAYGVLVAYFQIYFGIDFGDD